MLDVLRYQNEMTGRKRDIPLVAGIAIGTTYSGDAFSTRDTYKIDPLKIHANPIWKADGRSYLSLKIPTCLLLNINKEFDSFGYEAENKYAELVMNGQQDDYYYFHRFQMKIRNIQSVKGDMVLMDINGKPAPAVEVYAHSIRALVNHLMYTLPQGTGVKSNDIQLVITVPGTCNWTEYIKEFTRKSAEKAGIQQDNLLILKEPEAAFIYCQHLPTEKLSGAKHGFSMSKVGSRYIIVDLGGATFDVAVIEKLTGDGIKEVCRYPIKGGCAGTSIDTEFIQLFGNIFGEPLLSTMKGKHPLAYLDLLREFEAVKMTMTSTKTKDINIKLPYCTLDSLCKQYFERDVTSTVMDSSYASLISIRGDKMRLDNKLFHGLFDKTIKSILDILKYMFKRKNRQTDTVLLLVGSFSECPLVQEAIRKSFPFNQVIVPEDSGLAVLKGAVIYGHKKKTNDSDNDVQESVGLPKYFDVNRLDIKRSMSPSHFDSRVSDIGEMENVDYTEHFDIQEFDFTKRTPPLLFDDDSISDSAKTTCNTIVVGFEMTVSQLILVDKSALTKSFGKTESGSKMLTEIERNKNIWFHDKPKEMSHRISLLKELLIAIDNRDYDEIMRIYYRSQHIHTFDEDSCPFPVHVYIEEDRLSMKWLPHIQNAIEKISVAAPGIKFIQTKETFDVDDGSLNFIQIGIDDPDLREHAYTSFENGYPFIHLGDDWNPDRMKRTSIHELLHALGFSHGMERFDSNLYLDINTEGLDASSALQYERNPLHGVLTRFDPFSIMMYKLDEDTMKKVKGDPIWDLKEPEDTEEANDLSELDKLALNLMYKPCKSDSKYAYAPVISETTNMLYCGRDVMQSHNQNVPPTLTSTCGPNIWANCPSCRVFTDVKFHHGKEIKINTIQRCLKEGKWQGLSGNFYCGRKFAEEFHTFRFNTCISSDGICGPDQGIPCTECGGILKPGYSYKDFRPIRIPATLLDMS